MLKSHIHLNHPISAQDLETYEHIKTLYTAPTGGFYYNRNIPHHRNTLTQLGELYKKTLGKNVKCWCNFYDILGEIVRVYEDHKLEKEKNTNVETNTGS